MGRVCHGPSLLWAEMSRNLQSDGGAGGNNLGVKRVYDQLMMQYSLVEIRSV